MTKEEVLEYLCYYDKRNPYGTPDEEERQAQTEQVEKDGCCYCDNCFYGKTKLALELLKYIENEVNNVKH